MSILSSEQKEIVKYSKYNNIIVDSVAGSGKSTTIEGIINDNINDNILVLMYNNKLRKETINRFNKYTNSEIHTYHSFGNTYYINKCNNDDILLSIINNNIKSNKIFKFNRIILDESQDVNKIRFMFTEKIIKDNNVNNLIINILGDKYQCIYNYDKDSSKRSNIKYCTDISLFNKFNDKNWKKLELSNSFRLNNNISNFINVCMLNNNRIKSNKEGDKPYYYICNPYIQTLKLFSELINNYKPEDIFILSPTLKCNDIDNLYNEIKIKYPNIKICLSNDKNKKINDKVLISTYHASKGLERKVVIVFGFDNNNFIQKRNYNKYNCPNEFYVALTRSTEKIYLIHNYKYKHLEFINKNLISKYTHFYNLRI